jgi:hypothetical protein
MQIERLRIKTAVFCLSQLWLLSCVPLIEKKSENDSSKSAEESDTETDKNSEQGGIEGVEAGDGNVSDTKTKTDPKDKDKEKVLPVAPKGRATMLIVQPSVIAGAKTFSIKNISKELSGEPPVEVIAAKPLQLGVAEDGSYRIKQRSANLWTIEIFVEHEKYKNSIFEKNNTYQIFFDDRPNPDYVMTAGYSKN